jgi:hypothetical protein
MDVGEQVYKVGRSANVFDRLGGYPDGSKMLFCVYTPDVVYRESLLLHNLTTRYPGKCHHGREYFTCDVQTLIKEIMEIVIDTNPNDPTAMFSCKRCGYASTYKGCLRRHLKNGGCQVTKLGGDISRKVLLRELDNDPGHYCKFCKAIFASERSRYRHQSKCRDKAFTKPIPDDK